MDDDLLISGNTAGQSALRPMFLVLMGALVGMTLLGAIVWFSTAYGKLALKIS